jgi:type IV fimbrial biogenesis protein FimT
VLTQRANRASGFTLLEMIVTIAIFGILVALGVPAMRTWISNVKVRAVADALQNGVRLAQSEALRRSRQVVFSLTNSTNPQAGFTAVANGNYWSINTVPAMLDGTETSAFVGSGVLSSTSSGVTITASQAAICFNSAGRLVANSSSSVTNITGGTTGCTMPSGTPPSFTYQIQLTGADHPLNVQVALGGQVHLCDPSQTLSGTNTYGC